MISNIDTKNFVESTKIKNIPRIKESDFLVIYSTRFLITNTEDIDGIFVIKQNNLKSSSLEDKYWKISSNTFDTNKCENLYEIIYFYTRTYEIFSKIAEYMKKLNTPLLIYISKESFVNTVVNMGFTHPYITDSQVDGYNIPVSLAFYYFPERCVKHTKNTISTTKSIVKYTLKQYAKLQKNILSCSLKIKLSKGSLDYLLVNTLSSDREESGMFEVYKIQKNIFYLQVCSPDNLEYKNIGNGQNVHPYKSFFTYHTHPLCNYKKFNVKTGIPSVHDYKSFYEAFINYNTVFHLVISIEGIYCISFSSDWIEMKEKNKDIKDWILKSYKFKMGTPVNIYLKAVNNLRYLSSSNSLKIFDVQFLTWDELYNNGAYSVTTPRIFKGSNNIGNCTF